MKIVGKIIAQFVLMAVELFSSGLLMMKLWKWFVVPPFGLPELGYAHSVGFAVFIAVLKTNINLNKEKESLENEFVYFVVRQFIILSVIGVCWVISRFTM